LPENPKVNNAGTVYCQMSNAKRQMPRPIIHESLADAKVRAWQQCTHEAPSEEIYSRSTICDFLWWLLPMPMPILLTVCDVQFSTGPGPYQKLVSYGIV